MSCRRESIMIEISESKCTTLEETTVALLNELYPSRGILSQAVPREEDLYYYRINCADGQITTSYFIGVNWVIEKRLPIYVKPKLNNETTEINYLSMLMEALQEPENIEHLDGLVRIEFNKPAISIFSQEDTLSLFLIIQFLQILKRIVGQGLKKAYYPKCENLHAKVRGKILVNDNLRKNMLRGHVIRSMCQFQEYGVDCEENRLLKKAFLFSQVALTYSAKKIGLAELKHTIDYIRSAFDNVSDCITGMQITQMKTNPLYREYTQAIKLAKLILKRYSYNISVARQSVDTPPFWIDMSKLFELYVYKKLREQFSKEEVHYHFKARHQELDFILKPQSWKSPFVIDAKYKPRYQSEPISVEDIRQISGYARLRKVYNELGIKDENQNIKCWIIYAHQGCSEDLPDNEAQLTEVAGYTNIFQAGIRLPEIQK